MNVSISPYDDCLLDCIFRTPFRARLVSSPDTTVSSARPEDGSGRRAGPGAMTQEADIPPPPRVVVDEDPESSAAFKVRPRG